MPLCHFHSVSEAPCPPAGAMIRRRKSVLFKTIHCRTLNLLASSFATLSHASRNSFERPFHSTDFNLEDAFVFLPISALKTQNIRSSSFWGCRLCPDNTLPVPDILWQETLVAIGIVFLPPLLSRHPSQTSSLSIFRSRSTPTFFVSTGLFLAFSKACHDAPSFPRPLSNANSSMAPDPLPSNFRCNTADTDWPCVAPHHPRPLPKQTARI